MGGGFKSKKKAGGGGGGAVSSIFGTTLEMFSGGYDFGFN